MSKDKTEVSLDRSAQVALKQIARDLKRIADALDRAYAPPSGGNVYPTVTDRIRPMFPKEEQ